MGTFAVLAVLALAVGLAVRKLYRDKKKGISLQCGAGCDHCGCCTGGYSKKESE